MFSKPYPWPDAYVATVGVFDGLHLGHRAILDPVLAASREMGLPAVVFTFQPRPVTVFAPGTPHDELTPLPRKLRLLAEARDRAVVHPAFLEVFAQIEPEEFLTEILGAGVGLRGLWIGHDFRFGHRRRGDWDMLEAGGGSTRVSRRSASRPSFTTAARSARPASGERLRAGGSSGGTAARPVAGPRRGAWCPGAGRGGASSSRRRTSGCPTAQCLPGLGVYAGQAEWDGTCRPAVLNLGRRPTLTAGEEIVPEVHVLDFGSELLGRGPALPAARAPTR